MEPYDMLIKPIPDDNSDFEKVHFHTDYDDIQVTPHCREHGAMNKVSVFEGGGYWRCCNVMVCRAGCMQVNE